MQTPADIGGQDPRIAVRASPKFDGCSGPFTDSLILDRLVRDARSLQ